MRTISTFSIVGRDPETGELGIAVQSKFLAVGAMVCWAKADAGAIATQANANLDFGEIGLKLLEKRYPAQKVLDALLALDDERDQRQVGIVDAQGRTAAYTGSGCHDWAGHICGESFSAQGNILASGATVQALADTFQSTAGPLADRLVKCLDAAQNAGGDRRGRQSAALLVVREGASYGGYNDVKISLRVDDHPEPIRELRRLLDLHDLYFGETLAEVPAGPDVTAAVQARLRELGYYAGPVSGIYDDLSKRAYSDWCGVENYEERICEGDFFDERVLNILLQKA
ncbi:MAG: DUF1028 domain-containing protein [Clostridia bacterium]|nr:DUF1028 domain-containing protein [Clostridia bacterium]